MKQYSNKFYVLDTDATRNKDIVIKFYHDDYDSLMAICVDDNRPRYYKLVEEQDKYDYVIPLKTDRKKLYCKDIDTAYDFLLEMATDTDYQKPLISLLEHLWSYCDTAQVFDPMYDEREEDYELDEDGCLELPFIGNPCGSEIYDYMSLPYADQYFEDGTFDEEDEKLISLLERIADVWTTDMDEYFNIMFLNNDYYGALLDDYYRTLAEIYGREKAHEIYADYYK